MSTIARVAQLETAFSPPVATTATASAAAPTATAATGTDSTGTTSTGSTPFANQLQGALATGGVHDGDRHRRRRQRDRPDRRGRGRSGRAATRFQRFGPDRDSTAAPCRGPPPASRGAPTSPPGSPARRACRSADQGQGFGYVGDIWNWAQQTGRAIVNGPGVVPSPGNLIIFGDHHVGIVEKVLPNGSIQTIEGNYSDQVSRVVRGAGEATGYVRLG